VVWVLINNQAVGLEAMLRNVPSLIRGVPKPVRRILGAFTTDHNFIIDLETNERSVFAVFAYSNNYAHARDSTLPPSRCPLLKVAVAYPPNRLPVLTLTVPSYLSQDHGAGEFSHTED
jgi:hypothetical protein